jgi:hypothetical protein
MRKSKAFFLIYGWVLALLVFPASAWLMRKFPGYELGFLLLAVLVFVLLKAVGLKLIHPRIFKK